MKNTITGLTCTLQPSPPLVVVGLEDGRNVMLEEKLIPFLYVNGGRRAFSFGTIPAFTGSLYGKPR